MFVKFDKEIKINGRNIGRGFPPYIIAEAGVAHFGSLEKAFRLCDLAHAAKADSIKFQIFKINELYSKISPDWIDRLSPRQMSPEDFLEVKTYCDNLGLTFFATAHDLESLYSLIDIGIPVLKVGSGEKLNFSYLKTLIKAKLPIFISLGMHSIEEIKSLVEFLVDYQKTDVVLLHCVTEYPASPKDINLKTISWLAEEFNVLSGYSDHTEGHHIAESAVHYGAVVIEKHISLDFNVKNAQDWKVSCGPNNFQTFVKNTRDIFDAIGKSGKFITSKEIENEKWATKGIYANKFLKIGTTISNSDISVKRPREGILAKDFSLLIGKKLLRNIERDHPIDWSDISE